jgi:NDP-sugar pyrophosphorylase family protein
MMLTGWRNISTGEEIIARNSTFTQLFAFSGIQIMNPKILDLITEKGKFSLIPLYLRLAADHKIFGFEDTSSLWMDLGKPGQIEIAEKMIF